MCFFLGRMILPEVKLILLQKLEGHTHKKVESLKYTTDTNIVRIY